MTTKLRLSDAELEALDETEPASEYACGEVFQKPMPTTAHSALQLYLAFVLHQFLARTGLGRVFPELRCVFGPAGHERWYCPDLVVVLKNRLPPGDLRETRHLRTAPNIAIEILSPDQSTRTFVSKVAFYVAHGVQLLWIVDPAAETVLVMRPGSDDIMLGVEDQLEGGELLPGFSLPLRELFDQLLG